MPSRDDRAASVRLLVARQTAQADAPDGFLTAAVAALADLRDRLPLDDTYRHDVDPDDEALRLAGLAHPELIPSSDWTPPGGAA